MNEIIKAGARVLMSTREIAELTGKEHKDVLRDVRVMLGQLGLTSAQFRADLPDSYGRLQTAFKLPKDLSMTLVSGYNVVLRKRIVDRWLELEAAPAPRLELSTVEWIELCLKTEKERAAATALSVAQAKQIAEDAPKVEFAEAIRNMNAVCDMGAVAQALEYGRTTFFDMMRKDGIIQAVSTRPYQQFLDNGFFRVVACKPIKHRNGTTTAVFSPMVTGKGFLYLQRKYKKPGRPDVSFPPDEAALASAASTGYLSAPSPRGSAARLN